MQSNVREIYKADNKDSGIEQIYKQTNKGKNGRKFTKRGGEKCDDGLKTIKKQNCFFKYVPYNRNI